MPPTISAPGQAHSDTVICLLFFLKATLGVSQFCGYAQIMFLLLALSSLVLQVSSFTNACRWATSGPAKLDMLKLGRPLSTWNGVQTPACVTPVTDDTSNSSQTAIGPTWVNRGEFEFPNGKNYSVINFEHFLDLLRELSWGPLNS